MFNHIFNIKSFPIFFNVYFQTHIQFSSVAQSCLTLCDPMDCSMPVPPCPLPTPIVYSNSCPLSKWCHPTISSSVIPFSYCLQSFPEPGSFPMSHFLPSGGQTIGQSFGFSISPSNEYSGLISFRMDWFALLVVQETLKSLLQYHSAKASTLRCSALFIVQLSHPYMTTGNTKALTRQIFVGKVMSHSLKPLPTLQCHLWNIVQIN